MMTLGGFAICAGACGMAVLVSLGMAPLWRLIPERLGRTTSLEFTGNGLAPRHSQVSQGVSTLVMRNRTQGSCRLVVRGPELVMTSPHVAGGRQREWTVHLAPGTYTLSVRCRHGGAEVAEGRQGVLQVAATTPVP